MEAQNELRNFLDESGRLTAYPARRKMKLYALVYLAAKFESGRIYKEDEINDIIDTFTTFHDPATVRREMCGYRF